MNVESCKRLTEFIGECWHEWKYIRGPVKQERWECVKCQEYCVGSYKNNRTFHTANDMQLVKDELVKRGWWKDFIGYMVTHTEEGTTLGWMDMWSWLFSETPDGYRLCILCAEFLKQKEG